MRRQYLKQTPKKTDKG